MGAICRALMWVRDIGLFFFPFLIGRDIGLNQCCEYHFSDCFGLVIGNEYFNIGVSFQDYCYFGNNTQSKKVRTRITQKTNRNR